MTESLIKDWREGDFDFSDDKERHRAHVQGLIDSKVKGMKIVVPKEENAIPIIVNLMDALRKTFSKGAPT